MDFWGCSSGWRPTSRTTRTCGTASGASSASRVLAGIPHHSRFHVRGSPGRAGAGAAARRTGRGATTPARDQTGSGPSGRAGPGVPATLTPPGSSDLHPTLVLPVNANGVSDISIEWASRFVLGDHFGSGGWRCPHSRSDTHHRGSLSPGAGPLASKVLSFSDRAGPSGPGAVFCVSGATSIPVLMRVVRQMVPVKGDFTACSAWPCPWQPSRWASCSWGAVDTVMVGHLSARDLAAVALGNLYFFLTASFGLGTLFALDPLVSQALEPTTERESPVVSQRGIRHGRCPRPLLFASADSWPAFLDLVAPASGRDSGGGRVRPGLDPGRVCRSMVSSF